LTKTPRENDLAIVISDLSSGGAQRVVATLANHWASLGRSIAVVTLADPKMDYFTLDQRVVRFVAGKADSSHSFLGAIAGNIRRIFALRHSLRQANAPTVVAFVGATNVLTALAATGLPIKVVISERNDPARQSLGHVWNFLRSHFYKRAQIATANSQSAITTMSAFIPAAKLRLVHNPILVPDPRPETNPEPLILNVGRLVHQKAQDVLLEAFAMVTAEAPDWRLAIVGEGPDLPALKSRATTLGIADKIEFIGRADPWPFYARAAIFALPSRYEGTSNALLESMTVGIPPVISDKSGGGLDVVTDGVSGLIAPVDDPKALADALRRLIRDPDLRRRIGRAAALSVANLNLETVAADWEVVLGLSA